MIDPFTKHMPLPWTLSREIRGIGNVAVSGAETMAGDLVANTGTGKLGKFNAAFIVKACNAHDALTARVAKLEAALREIAYEMRDTSDTSYAMAQAARTALAKSAS